MIKFKHAGNGHFVRFSTDENGNEILGTRTASFSEASKPKTMGAGFWQGKKEWEAAGNVVESQYTAEEQAEKETKDTIDLILSKNAEARSYLNDTDWKVIRHRDQVAKASNTSLTETKYKALLTERQTARDSVIEDDEN